MSVDLALVLAVDCSSSVDAGDYHLQMFGIAEALRSPKVLDAIQSGENQRVAFSLVHWSTHKSQPSSLLPHRPLSSHQSPPPRRSNCKTAVSLDFIAQGQRRGNGLQPVLPLRLHIAKATDVQ